MMKWGKLFGNQYFGLWLLGFVCFVIQEIPYMLMPFFKPETNPIMNMPESSVMLEICEKASGSLCIVLMVFVVHKNAVPFSIAETSEKIFFSLAILVLLANFAGWVLYAAGHQSVFVMMFFLVLLPPLYDVFIGLWRKNTPLAATGIVFLVIHMIHVWGNLNMK